ncbi:hypothetical protein E2562_032454 [Oryza meyeriana var. granulata]|uniref:Uncharacterized protein n=1 Tax=Oryza meyeriana var. granulata TaxID=110450 RepID=A0A6G1FEI0_9ORYZ|nr:hypothetical protein E2562_032454 [Oryza meyeriana var. granulata]
MAARARRLGRWWGRPLRPRQRGSGIGGPRQHGGDVRCLLWDEGVQWIYDDGVRTGSTVNRRRQCRAWGCGLGDNAAVDLVTTWHGDSDNDNGGHYDGYNGRCRIYADTN